MKKRVEVNMNRMSPSAAVACVLMLAAAVIRLVYFLPTEMTPFVLIVHLLMPVTAAVLFIAGTILTGRWFRLLCTASVALGVLFFFLKAFSFSLIHQTLCSILYTTVLVVYTATVQGIIPTKKLLYPLFGLPFLYHVFVEDTQYYFFADPPVPFREWLPEISVLCIMAALFWQTPAMTVKPVRHGK